MSTDADNYALSILSSIMLARREAVGVAIEAHCDATRAQERARGNRDVAKTAFDECKAAFAEALEGKVKITFDNGVVTVASEDTRVAPRRFPVPHGSAFAQVNGEEVVKR